MQLLSTSIDLIKKRIKKSREELTSTMKLNDRLELEKSNWEKKVKEVMEIEDGGNLKNGEKEFKRDKAIEKDCNT